MLKKLMYLKKSDAIIFYIGFFALYYDVNNAWFKLHCC